MKPGVADGIAIIERPDKATVGGIVRIKRIDEGLTRRQQNKNEKQRERGNEEEDLAASSHGVFDEIPNSKLQTPKKSRHRNTKNQAPNTNEIPNSKLQTLARA